MFPTPAELSQSVFITEQMKALRKLGIEMKAIAPTPWVPPMLSFLPNIGKYIRIPKSANVQGIRVTYPRYVAFPRARFRFLYGLFCYLACRHIVRKHVEEDGINVIHAHTIMPDGFAALLLGNELNIPVVCTVHGSDITIYPQESWATLLVTKWALRRIKHLIAVSEDLGKKVNLLIGTREIKVIRNGADEELFHANAKSAARTSLALPDKAKIVLFIGNLVPVKGTEYLLQAIAHKSSSDFLLYLVGDGMLRDKLRAQAEYLGISAQCVFVGARPHEEIASWLSAADCLVISSVSEGFPTIIAEAMMCRVPVVATAVGGIPEVVKHGCTGLLVQPRDPVSLGEAVCLALENDTNIQTMVNRAEEAARAELTWGANARKTVEVYREALAQCFTCNAMTTPEANMGYGLKRLFDLCIAVAAVVLTAPIMLLTSILVACFLGRPVLFRQQRPGRNAEIFTLFKFRTMTQEVGEDGELLPDSERLTLFGRFLRSSSLDELPELINVLRGEMSIVGPRPLLVRYLRRYSSVQMRRHEANPGITGWAQVNGRNALPWDQRLAMDVWYVDHQSFWLDVKIVAMTPWTLLTRRGIDEPGWISSSDPPDCSQAEEPTNSSESGRPTAETAELDLCAQLASSRSDMR